jgi:hypothetical protein
MDRKPNRPSVAAGLLLLLCAILVILLLGLIVDRSQTAKSLTVQGRVTSEMPPGLASSPVGFSRTEFPQHVPEPKFNSEPLAVLRI